MHSITFRSTILLTGLFLMLSPNAHAASKADIDAKIGSTMTVFYSHVKSGKALAQKAEAILVFPDVVKGGFIVGGEYGEGALLVGGKTKGYYSTAAASIGLQIGGQVKSEVIMFMTKSALSGFLNSSGWKAGVDGSIALIEVGAGGEIDTNTINDPIIGFIFSNKGLMFNFTFEGSKITRLKK